MNGVSTKLPKSTGWDPITWLRPLSGVSLVVPFYHMVSDKHVPHVSNLYRFRSIAEFARDLDFFVRKFVPVSLSDIADALDGKRGLPETCVHVTFDDGFKEVYEIVAPMLERYGVPATFFVNTAFLDGGGLAHYNAISVLLDQQQLKEPVSAALTEQIDSILGPAHDPNLDLRSRIRSLGYGQSRLVREIAAAIGFDFESYIKMERPILTSEELASLHRRGFSIGAHSHTHPLYSELELSQQIEQTRVSIEWLASRFEISPRAFAFPHNDDGVEEGFFTAVFSERILDVSFGTSGLVSHFHPRNIERVSMEKTPSSAAQILTRQFSRAMYHRVRSAWGRRGAPASVAKVYQ